MGAPEPDVRVRRVPVKPSWRAVKGADVSHGIFSPRIQGRAHRVFVVIRSLSEDGAHCEAAETQRRTASAEEFAGEEAVSRRGNCFA